MMNALKTWTPAVAIIIAFAVTTACAYPKTSNEYFNRGVARLEADKLKRAISDFDQAIKIRPRYLAAYVNRANAKMRLHQYQEAIADYDQVIQLKPDHAWAHYSRGTAKYVLGHKGAATDLKTALKLAEQTNDSHLMAAIEQRIQELEQNK